VGLILDTSTLVTAERRGHNVRDIFAQLRAAHGEVETGLAAVTLVELAHGIERAKLDTQRQRRQAFLDDLIADMTIHPLTAEIARLAGKLSGQEAERGITLPFEDLLIGATDLHLGFEVVTGNVRHFEMIPNLVVKQL
jgi:predicted nucleic acid-binding protein